MSESTDFFKKFQQLVGENESLKQKLRESDLLIQAKNNEIELLQQMLADTVKKQSENDIHIEELALIKHQMKDCTKDTGN